MKKYLVLFIILLCIVTLSAKPKFEVKLLNSFTLSDTNQTSDYYHYGVSDFAVILINKDDSLGYRYFCFDFQGNKVDNIIMPVDSISGATYGIFYLPESKQLTYCSGDCYLHYVNFAGQDMGKRRFTGEIISLFTKVLEYQGKQYLLSWSPYEAWDINTNIVTSSITCFVVDGDSLLPLRKRLFEKDRRITMQGDSFSPGKMTWGFLLDSNLDHNMVFVDEKEKSYKVTFSTPDSIYVFDIKRKSSELMYILYAGEDFLYLTTFKDNGKLASSSGVYDLKGSKVCSLDFIRKTIGKDEYIIDIVNDKLITHSFKNNQIRVYEVKLINK